MSLDVDKINVFILVSSLGQGCGHNLIAISGIGAAMAIKAALESGRVKGKVILYGTPAEG
jgi:metal-dependent amidase/aminoacylase/carboxypeptidase family protein